MIAAPRAWCAVVVVAAFAPVASGATPVPDSTTNPVPVVSPGEGFVVPEVPVDQDDGSDVTFERAREDSAAGVEVGLGWRGSGSGATRRSRSLRFSGDGLDGQLREGGDDPLSGAEVGGRGSLGAWRVGRRAPQWGCGWAVGAPVAPWSGSAAGAGLRLGPRGDVAEMALGDGTRVDAMTGSFARRRVAAVRVAAGGMGLVAGGARDRRGVLGLTLERGDVTAEGATDRSGRWRAEISLAKDGAGGRVALSARAGSPGFRPLVAPTRAGPPQALAAEWRSAEARVRTRAGAALWSFADGLTGARGRLEVLMRLAHHASGSLGVEEQRGTRRAGAAGRGLRQGWWAEWRGTSGPLGLGFGLENWGRRSRARDPVRTATRAALDWRLPAGAWLRAELRAYRSGTGEGYRAADLEADRVVLRSLSGAGERTRIEGSYPLPAGRVRAGLTWNATASRPARTQWTLDWTRRARIGRGAP